MKNKEKLRKIFLNLRKKKYLDLKHDNFSYLLNYIRTKSKMKKKNFIALYYPSNYELDILKISKNLKNSRTVLLLPKIKTGNLIEFVEWNARDVLFVNKFGILEPIKKQKNLVPDILLVPLLAFDSRMNRLGYGKGFYDRYLNNLVKLGKKFEAIGIAFSFQKYKKIPSSKFDFKLDNVFTEKGFVI